MGYVCPGIVTLLRGLTKVRKDHYSELVPHIKWSLSMNTAIYLKKQGASNPTYSHAVSNLIRYAKFNIFQFNPFTATFAKHQLALPSTFVSLYRWQKKNIISFHVTYVESLITCSCECIQTMVWTVKSNEPNAFGAGVVNILARHSQQWKSYCLLTTIQWIIQA